MEPPLTLTYIGGPTVLLEFGPVRLLTDPTFDPGGVDYPSPATTLHKTAGPALTAAEIGSFDYVLLSHDHHSDNLDGAGRAALPKAKQVLTTEEGAKRLGGNSVGMVPWQSVDVDAGNGTSLHVVAAPARHGPEGRSRGPVLGFVAYFKDAPGHAVYFAGDTVWYEGVAEVAQRFPIRAAILNLGAARVPEVGPYHLTMTADEGVKTAEVFPDASIVPLHYEGWAHFSEGRPQIEQAFAKAGMQGRLRWLEPGKAVRIF